MIEERSKTQPAVREMLENQLAKADLGDHANAKIRLELRFIRLWQGAVIALTDFISWGEYGLFLADQKLGQFHSKATEQTIGPSQVHQPVRGISFMDAQWFCGWLSTQTDLAPEDGTYHYRLPTELDLEDLSKQPLPFFLSGKVPDSCLYIVRERVHPRYRNLINYLANARWEAADEETAKIMLEVANRTEQSHLDLDDIRAFPCEDLRLIDHLWLKFSGGHFGFSVQKEIYLKCGGKADYQYYKKALEKFGEEVGWRENNSWKIRYDLAQSPVGHLPTIRRFDSFVVISIMEMKNVGGNLFRAYVFSRIQACEL